MNTKVITRYENKIHDGNGYLHLDFDKLSSDIIILDMEVINAPENTESIWKIYSNNLQLDTNDLTKGKQAELKILKSYSGSKTIPHIFNVIITDLLGNILTKLDISVFATPKITEAFWGSSTEDKIYEVSINRNFTAVFKGTGLYHVPLKLDVFFLSKNGEDEKITGLSKMVTLNSFYDLADFYVNKDILKNHKMFFLGNTPTIFMEYISNSTKLDLTGNMRDLAIAKSYFIISHGDHVLFNGKDEKCLLNITFTLASLNVEEPIISLSPALVGTEEYFTQRYEPCKYEKIFFQNGSLPKVEVFDEKKPTQKNADGTFKNSKFSVAAIVPPKGSANIKELSIILEAVETLQCSLSDENKKLTNLSEESNTKEKPSHQGRVFNIKELNEAGINVINKEIDKKITIQPSFDYKYDKNSAWEFLKHYFLFSTLLDSKDSIQNELKSFLIGWEAQNKGIIDVHRIGLETCRYQKSLYLKTFADVAWAFHGFYNQPVKPRYYMDDEDVGKREGLDDKITWLQNYNQYYNMLIPSSPFLMHDSVNDFILLLIKDMASNYGLAFTAYYDFNSNGKCDQRIKYAEQYPNLFDGLIAGAVTMEILVQVLLFLLTEGATAELLLARMSKAGVKMTGQMEVMAKKAEQNIKEIRKKKLLGTVAKKGFTVITSPSVSYYKGYRFVEDKNIGIQPLLEERIAFSPLFGIDHEHKKNLGDLVYEKTPVYKVLDLSQKAFEGISVGINRYINQKYEAVKTADHYLQLAGDSFGKVNEYLAFVTEELIEKIFGTKAEYSVAIKGGYGMDFELKIHNADQKLHLEDFLGKGSVKDASVATIGSNKELNVEVKIDANVKVPVKAMNIINYMGKTNVKDIKAKGNFEISSGIFIERRYFFHADNKQPYYRDSVIFTGVAGEYGYNLRVETNEQNKNKSQTKIKKDKKPKKFVLIPPQIITQKPVPVFENPAK